MVIFSFSPEWVHQFANMLNSLPCKKKKKRKNKRKKIVPASTLLQAFLQTPIFVFTVSISSPLFSLPPTLFSGDPYFSTPTALVLFAGDFPLSNDPLAVWLWPLSSLEKSLSSFLKHFFLVPGHHTLVIPFHSLSLPLIYTLSPGNPPGPHFTWLLMTLPNLYFQPCSLTWDPDSLIITTWMGSENFNLTIFKTKLYCSLFKLSASQVVAIQFFRLSPNSILTLCPVNH